MSILKFSYYRVKAVRKGLNLRKNKWGFVVDLPNGGKVGPLTDKDMIQYLDRH